MRSGEKYDSERPIRRLEKGDTAIIRVTHFYRSIVKEKDQKKYGHIPNGKYLAEVTGQYSLECKEYPELSGKYNYWHGDKYGCSDGIYADEADRKENEV